MAKLIYGMNVSLDGYATDADGGLDWTGGGGPEVHEFFMQLEANIGTYVYGRRLYETMKVWQDMPDDGFARHWRGRDKVVVSSTLAEVDTPRTTLLRSVDAAALEALKAEASAPLYIGGPTLAASALRAGAVDEVYLVTWPAVLGGGLRALPDGVRLDLELIEERVVAGSGVYTRYRVR